ncbi:DUF3021 domain-containing protein [Lysinibacillus sp. G4S2]|uniref:DUF3021 domain-containing protein n=1 Tax=Lysinibacillus sp. G4S2 TaxID=3055859 RepID=UPI0025A29323|nr:DUF3021 domain-containing protein [Lysinibacillus sp. G4S2]MDM5247086.1 DUF3021 domain-containing protein [Lysinibacillus sp. G4S2]
MHFLKNVAFGVSMGCTVFVFINLLGYWTLGNIFLEAVMANFTQHVLGSIIVGIACALPSYFYQVERLTFLQQIAIHFAISVSTFIVVALFLNWLPTSSIGMTMFMLLLGVLLFTLIWLLFYVYNLSEAKKMNNKIDELINKDNAQ